MSETRYRGRLATLIENDLVRVTVLHEGGHIAEIRDLESGVNPLWTPPWESIEPSTYDRRKHPEYGADSESKLLSGIMGHNLCMDIFGPPSEEEAAAGLTVHGEASIAAYSITGSETALTARARMPEAQLQVERQIRLAGRVIEVVETVENESATDRPIAWTEHVTLGPPFLEKGATEFRAPVTKCQVLEAGLGDFERFTDTPVSGGFASYLMDPTRDAAFFVAWSQATRVALGYLWRRADFPWLGVWEENYSRTGPPWNGRTLTRGMEFGASPVAETRRQMIERGSLFGVPAFRWIPARTRVEVRYGALIQGALGSCPAGLVRMPSGEVRFEY
ncbi:MAG TPA: DUF4432 family protein [Bryobacteraceae bacterium]|jgi:hypothetical protein|nr:DUF4432 family protein [Bryobacteraceae bacterium]